MADTKPLEIPIDSIERDFDEFFSPDSNKRIIFSGPFGIGKTYFLDKFFEHQATKYYPVFLRPVSYSILSNEDIFKLIKYDIIVQILKDIDIKSEFEFSKLEYSLNFLDFNKYLILKNLLRHIPLIKQGIEIGQDMEKLVEVYQKGWSKINKSENENFLKAFFDASENHFLLEFDQVSKFISEQLDSIAEKKGTLENPAKKVLIIDDLDRLDPEHIFRLFNVFSAHLNHSKYSTNLIEVSDNKFGFDKIIFVCDIENIRKIFAHKYGDRVDFSGYIDKFYSTTPYKFLNYESIKAFIKNDLKISGIPIEANFYISVVCFHLMYSKLINLRKIENLFKEYQKVADDEIPYIFKYKDLNYYSTNYIWIRYLTPLKSLFGSYQELSSKLAENNTVAHYYNSDEVTRFKDIFIISSIVNTIRIENEQSINRFKEFKIKYENFTVTITCLTNIEKGELHIKEINATLDFIKTNHINFSSLQKAIISIIELGLHTSLLKE